MDKDFADHAASIAKGIVLYGNRDAQQRVREALQSAILDAMRWAADNAAPQASAEVRNAALEEAARKIAALAGEAAESYEATKEPYFEGKSDAYSHAENVMLTLKSAPVAKDSANGAGDVPGLGSRVINDACWKFIEAMPHQIPGPILNDLKPALYAAVCHVLADRQQRGGDGLHTLVAEKFASGNTIPVERITITRAELDTALAATKGESK